MAKKEDNKNMQKALALYLSDPKMSVKEISKQLDISAGTITNWQQKYGWTELREELIEKAVKETVKKVARNMAEFDASLQESFSKLIEDKFEELDKIKEKKNRILGYEAEDLEEELQKSTTYNNYDLCDSRIVHSILKVFEKLEKRYLPVLENRGDDNEIQISITSNGKPVNFLGGKGDED